MIQTEAKLATVLSNHTSTLALILAQADEVRVQARNVVIAPGTAAIMLPLFIY